MAFQGSGKKDLYKKMQGTYQRGGQGSTPMQVKSYVNKSEQSSYSASKLKDDKSDDEYMMAEEYSESDCKGAFQTQGQIITTGQHKTAQLKDGYGKKCEFDRYEQRDTTYMTSLDRGRKGHYYQSQSGKGCVKEENLQYWNADHSKMSVSKRNMQHEDYQREDNYQQNPHQIAMAEDEYSNRSHNQMQSQLQCQRTKEASKQMLYDVFGNLISMLEEFEERELEQSGHKRRMPRSQITISSQKNKRFEDIKRLVETYLYMFENQTTASSSPEAFAELKNDLRRRTINWAAVRSERGIEEIQQTDIYISKLYEILTKGSTQHYKPERCNASAGTIESVFGAFMKGNHDKETLDESFRANTNKKAMGPETRSSELLTDGARRIALASGKRELDHHLQNDLKGFQQEGPHDLR